MFRPTLTPWFASRYTGLFAHSGPIPRQPHDPAVCIWAATVPRLGMNGTDLSTGGAGWDAAAAEAAGVGHAVERFLPHPVPPAPTVETAVPGLAPPQPAPGP